MNDIPQPRCSSTRYASLRVFIVVLVAGFGASCVPLPFEWQDIPATNGQVVDAVSSKPIPSSTIVLTSLDSDKSVRLTTNEKGEFQSDRVWHWKLLRWRIGPGKIIALQDPPSYTAGLSVVARGYDPSYRRISGRSVVELKAITLQPANDDKRSRSVICPDRLLGCFAISLRRR